MKATIIRPWGEALEIKVFEPNQRVEHNGKWAKVVRMAKAGANGNEYTGHVVLTDRFGIHWEAWSNHCNCQAVAA